MDDNEMQQPGQEGEDKSRGGGRIPINIFNGRIDESTGEECWQ